MDLAIQHHLKKIIKSDLKGLMYKDHIWLKSILKDTCPELKKEIMVINAFHVNHFTQDLKKGRRKLTRIGFAGIVENFRTVTGYDRPTSEWCLMVWCAVLNKKVSFKPEDLEYPMPEITEFRPGASKLLKGTETYLTWNSKGASSSILSHNAEVLSSLRSGRINVVINQDEQFHLKLIGPLNQKTEKVIEVKAIQQASITKLIAEPDRIVAGQPVKLSWESEETSKVKVMGLSRVFKAKDEVVVYPKEKATYRIIASNEVSEDQAEIGVMVIPRMQMNPDKDIKIPSFKGYLPKQDHSSLKGSLNFKPLILNIKPPQMGFPERGLNHRVFFSRSQFLTKYQKLVRSGHKVFSRLFYIYLF